MSSGDGKCVIFLSFDSFFMWCEQLCPGTTFYFFYFIGNDLGKHTEPPTGATLMLPVLSIY